MGNARPRLIVSAERAAKFAELANPLLNKKKPKLRKKSRGIPFPKGNKANPYGRRGKSGQGGISRIQSLIESRRKWLAANGLTPLEFLLSVVHDPTAHMDYRIDAAKGAMPYVHRKMPIAIEGGDPSKPVVFEASVLAVLAPEEKLLLMGLMEKMANALSAQTPQKLIEGVARRESESDEATEKVE